MPFMGRRIGAYFFWFVFFVRAKKMDSPVGAKTDGFDFDVRYVLIRTELGYGRSCDFIDSLPR